MYPVSHRRSPRFNTLDHPTIAPPCGEAWVHNWCCVETLRSPVTLRAFRTEPTVRPIGSFFEVMILHFGHASPVWFFHHPTVAPFTRSVAATAIRVPHTETAVSATAARSRHTPRCELSLAFATPRFAPLGARNCAAIHPHVSCDRPRVDNPVSTVLAVPTLRSVVLSTCNVGNRNRTGVADPSWGAF